MSILLFGRKSLASRQLAVIRNLWSDNAPGLWYEPGQSAIWQDSAGTTPGAAGLPVGLVLDKRLGLVLGPELVANGGFDTDVSGWAKRTGAETITWADGAAVVSFAGAGDAGITRTFNAPTGRTRVSCSVTCNFTGASKINLQTGDGATVDVPIAFGETKFLSFIGNRAAAGLATFSLRTAVGAASGSFTVDNISVRELPGYPALQSTAPARPVYAASPDRLVYDDIDDAMVTTFPATLGSNCTIARAIPGVGAQILTGQTIGTSFTQTTTHAGMLIVARPLTASETTAVTGYLNRRAGV